MPKFNPVQWALPLSAMFLFAGLYARYVLGRFAGGSGFLGGFHPRHVHDTRAAQRAPNHDVRMPPLSACR